jgi:hypothetical protein
VRAHLEPASGILVGQPVRLVVEVLVPNYFTGSPDFPEFELENAIVVLPQERPQNANDHIHGVTYAAIKETYTLYPQQPGDFQLPPAQISVTYAFKPPQSTTRRASIPPLKFHADLPALAQGLEYFLPTTRLTIEQKWSTPLDKIRAGDTLGRTVTVTATKMQAMLIPPLPFYAPPGVRVYEDQPLVQDQKTSRGDFVFGRRTETAKYLVQKVGDYTLPSVELKWWNLSTKRMETAALPPVHFVAAPNPGFVTELPPEAEPAVVSHPKPVSFWKKYRMWFETGLPAMAGALLLLWLSMHYIPRIFFAIRAWRTRVMLAEPHRFGALEKACRRNSPTESYSRLLNWLALSRPGQSLEGFVTESSDPELSEQVNHLGRAIYATRGQTSTWNGASLAAALKRVRGKQETEGSGNTALPPINPVR